PTVLVQRPRPSEPWRRLAPGAKVFTNDALVSLPGYMSELRLDSGVRILLRGSVREFAFDPAIGPDIILQRLLLESAVVLHQHPKLRRRPDAETRPDLPLQPQGQGQGPRRGSLAVRRGGLGPDPGRAGHRGGGGDLPPLPRRGRPLQGGPLDLLNPLHLPG